MKHQAGRRSSADRGAVAIEFALVLPLLVILVFGIIDFGRLFNAQETLTQAAREGARLAALNDPNTCSRTAAAATGLGLSCPSSAVQITNCPSGAVQTTDAQVTLSYTFQFSGPLASLLGSPTMQLTGKGVMPCQG